MLVTNITITKTIKTMRGRENILAVQDNMVKSTVS